MNYEKKYKEALEKARELMSKGYYMLMPEIFPELVESEDERIRKMLIEQMERWKKCAEDNNVEQDVKDASDAIAYLEKQKEQNLEDIEDEVVRKYMKLDKFALANMLAERDKTNAEVIELFESIEEQPAEWSELEKEINTLF